jgi:hypothetical protein
VTQATRIIIVLLGVGLLCSAIAEGNPMPLIIMAAVGWLVWQVGQGLGGA